MSDSIETFWYVVTTIPRWEKKVHQNLLERGFESYCPLNRIVRQWSDRKKTVYEPLFKNYVFVKVQEDHKWEVRQVRGVLNFVYWLGKPARVKEEEIDLVKKFLMEFEDVQVVENQLKERDSVIINRGYFVNYRGIVLEVMGNKARVSISSMGVSLAATFDVKSLSPATKSR